MEGILQGLKKTLDPIAVFTDQMNRKNRNQEKFSLSPLERALAFVSAGPPIHIKQLSSDSGISQDCHFPQGNRS